MATKTQFTAYPGSAVYAERNQRNNYLQVAQTFREAIGLGALMSLGASNAVAVPGANQLGGLLFTARILPMTKKGRGQVARRMAVMVSLSANDLIDVQVVEIASGKVHFQEDDLYISMLERVLLALDWDGDEVANPRLWGSSEDGDEDESGPLTMSPEDLYEATHWGMND